MASKLRRLDDEVMKLLLDKLDTSEERQKERHVEITGRLDKVNGRLDNHGGRIGVLERSDAELGGAIGTMKWGVGIIGATSMASMIMWFKRELLGK